MTAICEPSTELPETTTPGGGVLYEAANVPPYAVLYTRDSFGRVETKTEVRPGGTTLRCYAYDAFDRLAAVYDAGDSNGCPGSQLEAYTYDLNGNRASVSCVDADPPHPSGRQKETELRLDPAENRSSMISCVIVLSRSASARVRGRGQTGRGANV